MKKLLIFIGAVTALLSVSKVNAQTTASKDAVLSAYYNVKNALINGNATAANTAAKDLVDAVKAFPADQLTAPEKANWAKYSDKLQFDARHISESSDLAHQREHFGALSENMFNVLKVLKLNTAPVYRDYCPMKKLYWLSEYAAIKNPYYGNQMLTCGELKETLTAAK